MSTIWIALMLGCGGEPAPEPDFATVPAEVSDCVVKAADPATQRWGCVDENGNWAVPPKYLGLTVPGEVGYGMLGGGKREIIDLRGDSPEFQAVEAQSVRDLGAQRFAVKRDGRWGLFDGGAKELAPPSWSRLESFSDERAVVCAESGCGYIDLDGTVQGELRWSEAFPMSGERGRVVADGKQGFVDAAGAVVIEPTWTEARDFSEDVAWVKGDAWQIIDVEGEVRGTVQADEVLPFTDGRGAFKRDGAWGFVSATGKVVIEAQYIQVRPFSQSIALIQKEAGGPFGYMDADGEVVIEPQFGGPVVGVTEPKHQWMDFHEGRVAVLPKGGKALFGYIDRNGKWIVEPSLNAAEPFEGGFARVKGPDDVVGIDRDGRLIKAAPYTK